MSIHKKILSLSLSLIAGFCANACSVDGADDEIIFPNENSEETSSNSNAGSSNAASEVEMSFTYSVLSYYYINADTYLKPMGYYIDAGEENGYSAQKYEFPDVYFMYDQMNDYYTYYIGYYYLSLSGEPFTDEQSEGIGATFEEVEIEKTSKLVVSTVYPNSPADKANLKEGDTLLFIGKTAPGSITDFEKLASKTEGSTDTLTIKRGADTLVVKVSLFCYLEPTATLSYKDGIPVIKISEFLNESASVCTADGSKDKETGTAWEVEQILKKTTGPVIIDLRGNKGGNTNQCINIDRMFLSEKDTVVISASTNYDKTISGQVIDTVAYTATEPGFAKDRYVVLLADTSTASCSEIVLAGLASNKKSPIVGMNSYGKGIGQFYFDTPTGGFAITTSTFIYDKDMVSYHDKGFVPDFNITDEAKALEKAVELAKEGKEKRTHGYGTQSTGHFTTMAKKSAVSKSSFLRQGAYEKKTLELK